MKFLFRKQNKGYAILFTVVIVGVISMITIGMSNSIFKQQLLSSIARDSTTAFYQADLSSECALYAEWKDYYLNVSPGTTYTFECAGQDEIVISTLSEQSDLTKIYNLTIPRLLNSSSRCFESTITKEETEIQIETQITSRGYNFCNKGNLRTVEREIEINY